jgi:hypothetical protein
MPTVRCHRRLRDAAHQRLVHNSGKALDMNGASTADGAKLVQWSRTLWG